MWYLFVGLLPLGLLLSLSSMYYQDGPSKEKSASATPQVPVINKMADEAPLLCPLHLAAGFLNVLSPKFLTSSLHCYPFGLFALAFPPPLTSLAQLLLILQKPTQMFPV